ncbi:entericidin A/B family lipoprotein [Accumulibacter sp.]|nr:entericidin A/B family lipoprotein [Accumulibacter sp.]MCM8593748.1 entericidin A/B family lipoprotein [Accumulibacter sp.]MCM8627716.1 entericidin A/B family lipoprotein [Accumulibacter sp.]MDS4047887.1 entericidin A/B family lipoprotein [Accumulibacter sp.]
MKRNLRRIVLLGLLACSLGACNTVQGLGKDIQKGGQVIEKAAR